MRFHSSAIVALVLTAFVHPLVGGTLRPLGKFDFSGILSIDPSAESSPRIYFAANPAGLTFVKLEPRAPAEIVTADLAGAGPQVYDAISIARGASVLPDGEIWISGLDPQSKEGYAAIYNSLGRQVSFFDTGTSLGRAISHTRLVTGVSAAGSIDVMALQSGRFVREATISAGLHRNSIFIPMSGNRLAVVAQSSGELTVIDIDARAFKTSNVNSPAIQRSIDYFKGQHYDPKLEPSVISGATAGDDGSMFFLLGTVFPGEGGKIVKLDSLGNLNAEYSFDVPKGFSPRYIGVAKGKVYVANARAQGFFFGL